MEHGFHTQSWNTNNNHRTRFHKSADMEHDITNYHGTRSGVQHHFTTRSMRDSQRARL